MSLAGTSSCSARPVPSAPRPSTWSARTPDLFRVVALTAGGSNPELFEQQCAEFRPRVAPGMGEEASSEAAAMVCDVVLNGITGAVGLRPTLAALDAGNTSRWRTRSR